MSYTKSYNTEIAKEIGIQASLILNYIKWWVENKHQDKIYRTNAQISSDFDGTLSESQIQRAKKKLVEGGFVTISHDQGHTRTTHYKLTEKAMTLLGMIVGVVKETVKKAVKKVLPKKQKPKSSMEESFKKQGDTSHAIPMPADVLEKLRGVKKAETTPVKTEVVVVEEDEDEYFAALDFSMAQCQEKKEEKLSFSQLMAKAFNQVPNIEQFEKNRQSMELAQNFKEDY